MPQLTRLPSILVLTLFLFSQTLWAEDIRLELPVRCAMGRDCFIQNFFDHDAGPGWQDYACGHLAYDSHTGTDFRLKDLQQMQDGVEVIAAAPGTVMAIRDGEPDVSIRERSLDEKNPKEAGNAVRIAHLYGWETQYSHLRQWSVRVRPGQRVQAGDVLGLVGLSGRTEFPHVDFTVRKDGRPLDPFGPQRSTCGVDEGVLWSKSAQPQLAYQATALLIAGFAERTLTTNELQSGQALSTQFPRHVPVLVFHAEIMGVRRGDIERVRISGPDDHVLSEFAAPLDKTLAIRQIFFGHRKQAPEWPAGEYSGSYRLERGGQVVVETLVRVSVGD